MQGLKDIKPLVKVPDNSLWMLLLSIMIALLIMIALYKWFKKPKRKRKKRLTAKEIAINALKNINLQDSKQAVYDFTAYAPVLANETQKERIGTLIDSLSTYKYKKEVPPLSETDKQAIQKITEELVHV